MGKDKVESPYIITDGIYFRCNTPALLKEIVENALRPNQGILKRPLQIFVQYLEQIAERSLQLNDPVLNKLMCDLALYEEADQYSKAYNAAMVKQVYENYNEFVKTKK